jgi:competence protein ComFC
VGKTQALRDGLDAILSVALGASCASCGEILEQPTLGPVCDGCWRSLALLPPPAFRIASELDRVQAIGPHDGVLRAIVHALKYERRRSLARPIASLIRARCLWALEGVELAVPVPLHPSRRRHRGFNQALDLAHGLGVPIGHAIRKARSTASQTELTQEERRENVRGAFAPSRLPWRAAGVRGRIVVLVDDVSTTGATLDECAKALRVLGAREVRAVTAARAAMSRR